LTGRRRAGGDRGSFTVELAVGLPALMFLLSVGLTIVVATTTKAQCVDAAREAALAASRGADGQAAGARVAPRGATIAITDAGETVTATVRVPVRALGVRIPLVMVDARAVAAVEPGAPEPWS
jgi:Flp pilus assembly protein TadG